MFTPDNVDRARTMLANLARKGKAYAQGITELELKVQEATNEDKWGPHGSAMLEIARAAEDPQNVPLIMGVIYGRFKDRHLEWRVCYKALLLSEFLIKRGPMSVVDEMVREIRQFRTLQHFIYTDADKRDQGINVRQRASEIVNLLNSRDRITAERQKARQTAEKYRGLSSSDIARGGLGQSSYSSSSYSSTGFGSGGDYGGSDGGGYSTVGRGQNGQSHSAITEDDPVVATRRRIEQLRASNAPMSPKPDRTASEPVSENFTPVSGSINMDASTNLFPEPCKAGPKKLSEVKVNPAIAAAFTSMNIKPGLSKPASSASMATSSGAPPSAIDLLGDDFQPEPAMSTAALPQPVTSASAQPSAPSALLLDELEGPAVTPAAAPAQSAPAAGLADALDWGELAGPAPTAAAAAPGAASLAAPPADLSDPFSALSFDGPAAAPPLASTASTLDADFAPFLGAPSITAQPADPFAALQDKPHASSFQGGAGVQGRGGTGAGGMGSVQAAINSVPPPPSKDPFADLLG